MTATVRGQVLAALDDEWRTAEEVADVVGWSPSYVRTKLCRLQADGVVESRKIRTRLQWRRR